MQVTRLYGGKSENTVALFKKSIRERRSRKRVGTIVKGMGMESIGKKSPSPHWHVEKFAFHPFHGTSASFRSSPYKSIRITSDLDPRHRHRLVETLFLASLQTAKKIPYLKIFTTKPPVVK